MKLSFTLLLSMLILNARSQNELYKEQYRPQFHFSPAKNWCNDPNGLVYANGEYHLFYQFNPYDNVWGHMTWAHAVSKDLVHWQHLPVAIPEENGIMIFSGTCVLDKNNTSGLGKDGKAPMIAIYTGNGDKNQSQCLAYSNDNGRTWTKYSNNPILDLHEADFRDPKVFWHEATQKWVMCVMLSVQHKLQLYSSKNLLQWNLMSEFGPVGDTSSVWECPDLFPVPVENNETEKKWVLTMSMAPRMQYFVGEFDGTTFHNENPANLVYRPDYGGDYYAAIGYNQLPSNAQPVMIGWINNWNYANDIPTTPWKGAMSLPRNISVRKTGSNWLLVQQPLKELASLRNSVLQLEKYNVSKEKDAGFTGTQFEMQCTIETATKTQAGIRLAYGNNQYCEIGYDAAAQKLYIDRSKIANSNFNNNFKSASRFETSLAPKKNKLKLQVFFDNSIVEVFANDGEAVLTAQIFPGKEQQGIKLFSQSGSTTFFDVHAWEMRSAW